MCVFLVKHFSSPSAQHIFYVFICSLKVTEHQLRNIHELTYNIIKLEDINCCLFATESNLCSICMCELAKVGRRNIVGHHFQHHFLKIGL